MKRKRKITPLLLAAALCFAGLPQAFSAQTAEDKEAQAAEAAEEAAAAKAAEAAAAAEAAKVVVIDPQMLAKYKGMLDQLRAELTPKLPKTDDQAQVDAFLKSDKLDDQLVKVAVLTEATPEGLAAFAQQGKENEALIDQLLSNPALMKQMLVADGAKVRQHQRKVKPQPPAHYGPAMKIYTDIQKASPKAKDGVFHELALAVALELAIPIPSSNVIDPVERYLDFEKAYLDGELDPAFANFSAWELRFVVDGNEPDWVRAWGREMLRNYRPDHILTTSDGGRYVGNGQDQRPLRRRQDTPRPPRTCRAIRTS